jgi:hypothetical protein
MKNPIVYDGSSFGLIKVRAWEAAPFMKRALRKRADVHISYDDSAAAARTLRHGPEHRPMSPLTAIWPLSIFAAHDVVYHEYKDKTMVYVTACSEYSKGQIGIAVARFLHGLPDDVEISISVRYPGQGFLG